MPSKTGKPPSSYYGNDLTINQSGNTGVDTTAREIQDGFGNNTSLYVSDDQFWVKPRNDDMTATFQVYDKSGNVMLNVDTTNSLVTAHGVAVNTQYEHFGISFVDAESISMSDDTHYAIPFGGSILGSAGATNYAMGTATTSSFNDTEPATSLTISDSAQSIIRTYWYVMDDITIDRVIWWQGADAAAGSSTAAYLMGYSVNTGTGSIGGDIAGGVKLASSSTVTNAGYEQAYYNQMTIHSADVDAGKVILFTFCFDDTEATDYSINATVKFHLR